MKKIIFTLSFLLCFTVVVYTDSFELDGVDDKIVFATTTDNSTGASNDIRVDSAYVSMGGWVKLLYDPDDNNYHVLFGEGSWADGGVVGFTVLLVATYAPLGHLQNRLHFDRQFDHEGGIQSDTDADVQIPEGSWNHIVATAEGTWESLKLYVNGKRIAATAWTDTPSGTIVTRTNGVAQYTVGADADGGSYTNAVFKDVFVCNRTLTEGEINRMYEKKTGIEDTRGFVLYSKLDKVGRQRNEVANMHGNIITGGILTPSQPIGWMGR